MTKETKHTPDAVGIYIGNVESAVAELRAAIMDILREPHVDNSTKVVALEVLRAGTSISASVSGCNINMESNTP